MRKLLFLTVLIPFLVTELNAAPRRLCVRASDDLIVTRRRCRAPKFTQLETLNDLKGEKGEKGDQGEQGEQGDAGPFATGLPSAQSLTGVYAVGSYADAANRNFYGNISFGFPLESAPTVEVLEKGEAATDNCPGSASDPSAAPGYLCVYEGYESNRKDDSLQVRDFASPYIFGSNAATKDGAAVIVRSEASGNTVSRGSWAVTAP